MTFEFCHDITIWKMTIFDKVDCVETEPVLWDIHVCVDSPGLPRSTITTVVLVCQTNITTNLVEGLVSPTQRPIWTP